MITKISTDTQIKKSIKEVVNTGKQRSIPITGFKGLELRIRPNKHSGVTADFRHRYTHPYTNKRPYMTLGKYPSYTLEDARKEYISNLSLLANHIDPIAHRDDQYNAKVKAMNNTFDAVANNWLSEEMSHGTLEKGTLDNWRRYLKPLLTEFTGCPIDSITPKDILEVCKQAQKTSIHKGRRIKGMAQRIFAYAVVHDVMSHNPVLELQGTKILKTNQKSHRPAIIKPNEFACLLKDIDRLDAQTHCYNKAILQLLALTFVRVGDVCRMKWRDIDFESKQWGFAPQKGKNRSDMVGSLMVPLAPQAIEILQKLQKITGNDDYVFYNYRRKQAPYHDKQLINKLLNMPHMNKTGIGDRYEKDKGYKGVHCPHGFRASAKTMLMERLGYDELITEMQLGHAMLNSYGTAYNRMEATEKRTEMMREWANYLDDLKAGKQTNNPDQSKLY